MLSLGLRLRVHIVTLHSQLAIYMYVEIGRENVRADNNKCEQEPGAQPIYRRLGNIEVVR
jgi:hypothetical protein